jgi:hypothetical protein
MGSGCDPITGEQLGLAFPAYKTTEQRIEARIARLDATLRRRARRVRLSL